MEQLRRQNAQEKNVSTILGLESTLSKSEKRKELEKDKKKRKSNNIEELKNLSRLKKEIDDDTVKIIRLKKRK